jgi:uncharacterized membrane protein YphA (DoxX/SURF4 family)
MPSKKIVSLLLRLLAAVILLQTLFFKFSAAPESVYIFSTVGIEPWGRIGTGVAELIAAVLLLIPSTIALGAVMGIGIMLGAIATHLFLLGIEVMNDGGQLFIYALIVLITCFILVIQNRQQLLLLKSKINL